jgi:hypothetical protein
MFDLSFFGGETGSTSFPAFAISVASSMTSDKWGGL